jgi:ribonuclease BN (tRNA processing enzyme)
MLDGGPGAIPDGPLDAWLVSDEQSELQGAIRRLARSRGIEAAAAPFERPGLRAEPLPVRHTSHPTFGYRIVADSFVVAWAPEFLEFPPWTARADLLFAEAAGWNRPIRFARGAGGHASVHDVCRAAREAGVRRLVFAHIGRPTIRALDAGLAPPFGEIGVEGRTYELG